MQLSAHQKEFISADSSGTLLVDSTVCRLTKAVALLADGNQSHRDAPESRSNLILIAWSILLTGCPTEPDSMGENSSCPAIIDVPEPWGSSKQHIFRLISFPAFDSTIWKRSQENDAPSLVPGALERTHQPSECQSVPGLAVEGGPPGSTGADWVHVQLLVESAFSGSPPWIIARVSLAKVSIQREERTCIYHSSSRAKKWAVGETQSQEINEQIWA